MRHFLLLLIFINYLVAQGQEKKEFEGIIRYKHHFNFDNYEGDSIEFKNAFGPSSEFYYKKGSYKWVLNNIANTIEYFDSKTQTAYFLKNEKDTLFMGVKNGRDDSLIEFSIDERSYLVNSVLCKKAITVSIDKAWGPEWPTKRILYYSPDTFIGANRFSEYRSFASNKVYQVTKCWPIKIELFFPLMPDVTYEAVEVIPKSLTDSEVLMPTDKPIKPLPSF